MSLDGYIAKPNDDLRFLSIVEQEGQDYGYHEFIISVIPIILGDGVQLFKGGRPELNLRLMKCQYFDKGLVQLHCVRMNDYF
jgi:hypothetical protein